jgi:G6PDH family F420-dependent oxidoreductase
MTLAALSQRLDKMVMGTAVTCPTFRNNPAVVAQVFATLSQLAPGRVFLGVGTGEALNEVPTGGGWGPYSERAERLIDAIAIIRALWAGEWVTCSGRYYHLRDAHLFDTPAQPIPIYVAADGPKSARLAGMHGDGLIPGAVLTGGCTLSDRGKTVFRAFEEGARAVGKDPAAMPRLVELYAVLGDETDALQVAPMYQFGPVGASMLNVTDCREIRRIGQEQATPQQVLANWLVSPDPEVHAQAICTLAASGFTHVLVHFPQMDHLPILERYGREVLPAARRAMR